MTRLPAVLLSALLAVSPGLTFQAPSPAPAPSGDLEKGIQLARDGDFEGAVVELDAAVRALRELPARKDDLVRGLVYLATAYLQLDQELSARARLREAITLDPKLELSPREFSPQLLRVFEAVRADAGLPAASPAPNPSPIASPIASTPPRSPRPSPSPSPAKRRGAAIWIIGGGVAAAGAAAAVAAGGGGGGSAGTTTTTAPIGGVTTTTAPPGTTTTTTTTAPSPTTTTTTTTTTTLPPCRPTISGDVVIPLTGGSGRCPVSAEARCAWTAQASDPWINITNGSGSGDGEVRFNAPLTATTRAGEITLTDGSGRCRVSQSGVLVAPVRDLDLLSSLDGDSTVQLVVNGAAVALHGRGNRHAMAARREGLNRIEGVVVKGWGRPGTWRITIAQGALKLLHPLAGDVLSQQADSITFALSGRPGERIAFTFRTDE